MLAKKHTICCIFLPKNTHRTVGGKRNQRKLITFFLCKRIIKYEEKKVNSFLLAKYRRKTMARCLNTKDLEVHHIRIDGGNDLDNAMVLCHRCHVNTDSYGDSNHKSPPAFSETTKILALARAGNRCECTKGTCCNTGGLLWR